MIVEPVAVDMTPQAAKEAIALAQVERLGRELAEQEPDWDDIRNVPALLGFPVETEQGRFHRLPWATWLVAVLVAIISVLAFSHQKILDDFALVPAEVGRLAGLTVITSFFLHGGIWHLAGNLYFLIVFGDNVEDYLGRWRWLFLLFFAVISGALAHVLLNLNDTTPCVGASGGISGLLAFYAFRFPKARLGIRVWSRYSYAAPWITFPAWGGFVAWICLQLVGVWQQMEGISNVSSVAHLGGIVVGIAAWWLWRDIETSPAQPASAATT